MLRAILNKSWEEHLVRKRELYDMQISHPLQKQSRKVERDSHDTE